MSKAQELRENVARAIWNVMREYEDRCDMELEDMGVKHHAWEMADAAISASSEQQAAQQDAGLVEHVIDAARNAMNESVESMDDFIIESHLAAALSLALDELDAARASNGGKA